MGGDLQHLLDTEERLDRLEGRLDIMCKQSQVAMANLSALAASWEAEGRALGETPRGVALQRCSRELKEALT